MYARHAPPALLRYARHAAATPATARSPPPADLWQPALELPSQESREPPSQELRHQEAKAKSFDEQIFGHLLRADPQMLGDLADEFDNNPALAVPSGQCPGRQGSGHQTARKVAPTYCRHPLPASSS